MLRNEAEVKGRDYNRWLLKYSAKKGTTKNPLLPNSLPIEYFIKSFLLHYTMVFLPTGIYSLFTPVCLYFKLIG